MSKQPHSPFDFWYALNNTEIVISPSGRLETFGSTVVNYHLLTELMDSANQVRIREGRLQAYRPEIVTPQSFAQQSAEGFGEEGDKYLQWLKENEQDLVILKYGFMLKKEDIRQYVVHDSMLMAIDQVKKNIAEKDDPLSALLVGVDKPWEVCLLKLMVEVTQNSILGNVRDLQKHRLLSGPGERKEEEVRKEIEVAFAAAAQDRRLIAQLAAKLEKYGLFNEYEDRFFALVRTPS